MSLDEPSNHKHAAMLEHEDHPGWEGFDAAHTRLASILAEPPDPTLVALTRAQDAKDAAERQAVRDERDALESVEASISYWVGVSSQRPWYMDRVVWDGT